MAVIASPVGRLEAHPAIGSRRGAVRVVATDGSRTTAGPAATIRLTRGALVANEAAGEVPARFAVHGNYPNPFNPSTRIAFDLPEAAAVRVDVFDLLGRSVLQIPEAPFAAGRRHHVAVDAAALPSGVYLYRVTARSAVQTRAHAGRMTLLK